MRKLIVILLLFFSLGGFCQSQYTNWFTVLADSTPFSRALPSNTLIHLLDSNKLYQLQAAFAAQSYMAQVFASGNYREVPGGFSSLSIDTLFITDSIYDLRVDGSYFYFNDTIYGVKDIGDSLAMIHDTTTAIRTDLNTLTTSVYDSMHWTRAGGKLFPTTATDDVVAKDSLRVEGYTYLKNNTTITGGLIFTNAYPTIKANSGGDGTIYFGTTNNITKLWIPGNAPYTKSLFDYGEWAQTVNGTNNTFISSLYTSIIANASTAKFVVGNGVSIIGTNKFCVAGSSRLYGDVTIDDNLFLTGIPTAATADTLIAKNANGSLYAVPVAAGVLGLDTATLLHCADTTTYIGTKYDVDTLSASVYDSMHWTQSGGNLYPTTLTDNIGIGTTAPSAKLDVVGDVDFSTVGQASSYDSIYVKDVSTGELKTAKYSANDSLFWSRSATEVFPKSSYNLGLYSSVRENPKLRMVNSNADAYGSFLYFDKLSSSPAADDKLGYIIARGRDSGGTDTVDYARIHFESTVVTNASEVGKIEFKTRFVDETSQLYEMLSLNGKAGECDAEVIVNGDNHGVDFIVNSNNITDAFKIDGTSGQPYIIDSVSSWGEGGGESYSTHDVLQYTTYLEDGDSIVLPNSIFGWGSISTNGGATWVDFNFQDDATVTVKNSSADVDTSDTPAKFCIYQGVTLNVVIKNNLENDYPTLIEVHYLTDPPE
jgi:hypothetical protein